MAGSLKPPSLPPPEKMTPEMEAWAGAMRARQRELEAANAKLRDSLIEAEIARSRSSNEAPDDFVPLKAALAHAPHVHPEFARRLCAGGTVMAKQNAKGGRRRVSLSSFLRAVREHLG